MVTLCRSWLATWKSGQETAQKQLQEERRHWMGWKFRGIFCFSFLGFQMTWHGSSQPVYASQWVFCLEAGVELVQHGHTEACVLGRFSRVILLIVPEVMVLLVLMVLPTWRSQNMQAKGGLCPKRSFSAAFSLSSFVRRRDAIMSELHYI